MASKRPNEARRRDETLGSGATVDRAGAPTAPGRRSRSFVWIWGLVLALIVIAIAGWYWNDVYRERSTAANLKTDAPPALTTGGAARAP